MIFSLSLSLIAIASGAVLTYSYEENEPLASRLCSGACIGFALMGLGGFVLALFLGLTAMTLTATLALMMTPAFLLLSVPYRIRIKTDLSAASRAIRRAVTHPTMSLGKLLFSFKGRIAQGTFWIFWIIWIVMALTGLRIRVLLGTLRPGVGALAVAVLVYAYLALAIWIALALQVKRWHDLGYSGWMVLIGFIPFIGTLVALICLGFVRGTAGPNKYGRDPEPERSWPAAGYFLYYAIAAVVMWLIFDRAMIELPKGLYTGVLNNYGDLPFHLSVITRFAFGQNFPPEDPTFSGVRFTYPFITDFISAMFARAGASLRNSMFIENYIIGVALVGVVHRFGQQLLRNRMAAILTPVLILLNGGFGWVMLFRDVNKSEGGVFQVLRNIPHSYTILPEIAQAWRWGNSVTSLLVTQRGFLLGIPLAVIVFTQWWMAMKDTETRGPRGAAKKPPRKDSTNQPDLRVTVSPRLRIGDRRMIAAGVIAGLLPLIHAHSFIAVMLVAAFLLPWIYWRAWVAYGVALLFGMLIFSAALMYGALTSPFIKIAMAGVVIGLLINLYFLLPQRHFRLWICFLVVAVVLSVPQILWSTHGSAVKTQSFIAWQFGWDSDQETMLGSKPVGTQPIETTPPFKLWLQRTPYVGWFWLKNTGLFIPLLIIALLWKPQEYLVSRRLLLFYLPFTLCFIIPNILRLAPWVWDNIKILFYWWIASAPIVALFFARLWERSLWHRVLAASLFIMLILAGALDIFPLLTRQGEYQEFDHEGVAFAETIKQTTPPGATLLHAPIHNTPVFLTGRRSIMGYPGHIWTHGLDFGPREAEIKRIYEGAPDAEALLAEYRVDYVVISPQEHAVVSPNIVFFSRYPEVANIGDYHLYKITP
jgi:uncharacterized membrane protein YhaH (DUF805 family)